MSHHSITVLPSYPAPNQNALFSALDTLRGVAPEFQIDLVDTKFVPNISWPFTEGDVQAAIEAMSAYSKVFHLEFDLMVEEPLQYFDQLIRAGAQRLIVHHTSTEAYAECVKKAHEHELQIGIAILPSVAFDAVRDLIALFDYVQVMGIREVGKQGQSFAPETVTLIKRIREVFPEKEIAVDGAVNVFTIPVLVVAGATRLAPGSAIMASENPVSAFEELSALANSQLGE